MPIYEYVCMKCNEKFSLLQSIFSPCDNLKCPKCESNKVKKILSTFSCAKDAGSDVPSRGFGGG
jgi:putative FmdB family regulatory protein